MRADSQSFFKTMLGTKASKEVLVSRAFAACFTKSVKFRRVALTTLAKKCRLAARSLLSCEWHCESEVAVANGRLDLRLSPQKLGLRRIVLENKVAAILTREQMQRYRLSSKRDVIVAVTKRHPEVSRTWLEANACVSMRWQDIHQALEHVGGVNSKDSFLCASFRQYLEELDMAHSAVATKKDLARIAKLFRVARSDVRHAEINAQRAFQAALGVLALLDEVVTECRESAPETETWRVWGPSYFKWREEGEFYHHFAFRLFRNGWKSWAGAGFVFPDKAGKTYWLTQSRRTVRAEEISEYHYLSEVTMKTGAISVDALVRSFLGDLRNAGMIRSKKRR